MKDRVLEITTSQCFSQSIILQTNTLSRQHVGQQEMLLEVVPATTLSHNLHGNARVCEGNTRSWLLQLGVLRKLGLRQHGLNDAKASPRSVFCQLWGHTNSQIISGSKQYQKNETFIIIKRHKQSELKGARNIRQHAKTNFCIFYR